MKNKRKTLAILLSVVTVITMVLLTSYAIWRVSEKQSGSNLVVGGCLSIEFEDVGANGFRLDSAWPISDEDGTALNGYTFAIVNTCPKPVDYQVVLDQIIQGNAVAENQFDTHYVKTQTDGGAIKRYGFLAAVTIEQPKDNSYTVIDSRNIANGTVPGATNEGPGRVEHNVKLWISEDAPNEQINKNFDSKVKVYAGQGITKGEYKVADASCFETVSGGTVINYLYDVCGTDVVIPESIDGMLINFFQSESSFADRGKKITSLDISRMTGLTKIKSGTFDFYTGGEDLVIPENVEIIDDYAFTRYIGPRIVMPDSVTRIGVGAFERYQGEDLSLPKNLVSIGASAFKYYSGDNLVLPSSIEAIEGYAFMSYNGNELIIPNSLKTMGQGVFKSYEGKNTNLDIPSNVERIGIKRTDGHDNEGTFASFNGDSLTLHEGLIIIGQESFKKFVGSGSELVIPNTVTYIDDDAFAYFNGSSLKLSDSLEIIGIRAFNNYNGSDITIPSTIISIGARAFYNYNSSDITIPSTITSIGKWAFNSMDSTKTIVVDRPNLDGITLGDRWNGNATIKCKDNGQIIDCP